MNIWKLTSIALSVYKSPGLIRPLHHPIPSRHHHPVTAIFKLIPTRVFYPQFPCGKSAATAFYFSPFTLNSSLPVLTLQNEGCHHPHPPRRHRHRPSDVPPARRQVAGSTCKITAVFFTCHLGPIHQILTTSSPGPVQGMTSSPPLGCH